MGESEWLADRFEEHRAHLRGVAYRMLGTFTDADDAVQDAWLRLSRSGAGEVENLGGWLTTIVARVCLNMLRSRNFRREESFGFRVPDPVVSPVGELQPEDEAVLADSVGLALLVVLDALAPAERRGGRSRAGPERAHDRPAGCPPALRGGERGGRGGHDPAWTARHRDGFHDR
jgi:RNA polymerase sigma-70 factor (ECF subfamily)